MRLFFFLYVLSLSLSTLLLADEKSAESKKRYELNVLCSSMKKFLQFKKKCGNRYFYARIVPYRDKKKRVTLYVKEGSVSRVRIKEDEKNPVYEELGAMTDKALLYKSRYKVFEQIYKACEKMLETREGVGEAEYFNNKLLNWSLDLLQLIFS